MSKDIVCVRIDKHGSIKTIYSDDIPFLDVGESTIKRASDIKFDNEEQQWKVCILADEKPAYALPEAFKIGQRDHAVQCEIAYFNKKLFDKNFNE